MQSSFLRTDENILLSYPQPGSGKDTPHTMMQVHRKMLVGLANYVVQYFFIDVLAVCYDMFEMQSYPLKRYMILKDSAEAGTATNNVQL